MGGGRLKETVLWTNPNPTSSSGFANQTVTLSDNISNYKYISIKGAINYVQSERTDYFFEASQFPHFTANQAYPQPYIGFYNNNYFLRLALYISDTQIAFDLGMRIIGANKTWDNTVCIPISISGWK